MKFNHRILLLAISCLLGGNAPADQDSLTVERHGDRLHVIAPQFNFISGRAAERLRNGATVAYAIQLTVEAQPTGKKAFLLRERFAISFDLWEEKYSVVQKKTDGRSASRLTSSMAEAWCLENMPIPVRSLPEHQSFMIRLECFAEEEEKNEDGDDSPGLTLAALIDVFSRKKSEDVLRWEAAGGPFRLEVLKVLK